MKPLFVYLTIAFSVLPSSQILAQSTSTPGKNVEQKVPFRLLRFQRSVPDHPEENYSEKPQALTLSDSDRNATKSVFQNSAFAASASLSTSGELLEADSNYTMVMNKSKLAQNALYESVLLQESDKLQPEISKVVSSTQYQKQFAKKKAHPKPKGNSILGFALLAIFLLTMLGLLIWHYKLRIQAKRTRRRETTPTKRRRVRRPRPELQQWL